jgi:hypothetical protein
MFRNSFVPSRRRLPWSRERGLLLTASGRGVPSGPPGPYITHL